METYIAFLIRASVYLLVFGAAYYVLFAGSNRPVFNRFYLLLSFLLSVGLASFGQIDMVVNTADSAFFNAILLQEVSVGDGAAATTWTAVEKQTAFPPWQILLLGFVFVLLLQMILRVLNIRKIIKRNPVEDFDDIQLVVLQNSENPFSFFHWIFVPNQIKGTPLFDKVLTHERAHYLCRHSWDLMFMELMRLIFWFHPFFYLLRRELQNMHEFEADSHALKSFSRPDYQKALLEFSFGGSTFAITNPFNISIIKKRFIMMNTQNTQSVKKQWVKLLLLLPFLAMTFFIQSCNLQEEPLSDEEAAELKAQEVKPEDDVIFTIVENQPEFPGGTSALMQFLQQNLRYPGDARENGIQGTVFVSFVVEKNGDITNVKILRGVPEGESLSVEALRVVELMPAWQPGKQRGENVRVQFNLPIRFVLN